jgi:predicted RecA/RadA family phage recombinase
MATAARPYAGKVGGIPVMANWTNTGSAVYAGDVVVIGDIPAVAMVDIPAFVGGQVLDALSIFGGIYACMADGAISPGTPVFWDATAKKVSLTVGSNKAFGICVAGPSGGLEGAGPAVDGDTCYVYHYPSKSASGSPVVGVGSGYKVARGQHTMLSASDTVVTGLATVVSAVAGMESAPILTFDRVNAQVGNQSGAPAAGSIILNGWMPTDATHTTPIAATGYAGIVVDWIAIGT